MVERPGAMRAPILHGPGAVEVPRPGPGETARFAGGGSVAAGLTANAPASFTSDMSEGKSLISAGADRVGSPDALNSPKLFGMAIP